MAGRVEPGAAPAPAHRDTSPIKKGSSTGGVGATGNSITSAAVLSAATGWVARGSTSVYAVIKWPFSFAYRLLTAPFIWASKKIWGEVRVTPQTVKVSVPGWIWGASIQDISPSYALSKGYITYEDAISSPHNCNPDDLQAEGRHPVKFTYATFWSKEVTYEGPLRVALKSGKITIFEALKQKLITEKQAIAGKWVTAADLAKAKSEEAAAKKQSKTT